MPNEVPYILERLRKYWNPCLMVIKQSIKFLNKSTYTRNLHVWLGFRFSSKFLFLNTSLAQIEIELRSCIASKKLLQALADNTQQSIHVGFIVIKVFRITKSHLFLPGVVISSAMRWSRKIRWLVIVGSFVRYHFSESTNPKFMKCGTDVICVEFYF